MHARTRKLHLNPGRGQCFAALGDEFSRNLMGFQIARMHFTISFLPDYCGFLFPEFSQNEARERERRRAGMPPRMLPRNFLNVISGTMFDFTFLRAGLPHFFSNINLISAASFILLSRSYELRVTSCIRYLL